MAAVDIDQDRWKNMNQSYLGDFDAGIPLHSDTLYKYTQEYDVQADSWEDYNKRKSEMLQLYDDKGCIIIRKALSPAQVQDVLDGLSKVIDGDNESFNKAVEKTKLAPFDNSDGGCVNSILQFESAAKDIFDNLTKEEKRDYVRKLHGFSLHDDRFKDVYDHPEIRQLMKDVLRIDDKDAKAEVFQDMALFKPPKIGREKPWHQDNAYFNLSADTPVVGIWIALDEANGSNGCMHIIPGAHKKEGQVIHYPHFNRRDWQICDNEIENRGSKPIAAVCLKPGDMMVFTGLLPHGTPYNQSTIRRRAIQFHYVQPKTPRVQTEDRLNLFGGEGRGVQC